MDKTTYITYFKTILVEVIPSKNNYNTNKVLSSDKIFIIK